VPPHPGRHGVVLRSARRWWRGGAPRTDRQRRRHSWYIAFGVVATMATLWGIYELTRAQFIVYIGIALLIGARLAQTGLDHRD
jgi:hypothetical protein